MNHYIIHIFVEIKSAVIISQIKSVFFFFFTFFSQIFRITLFIKLKKPSIDVDIVFWFVSLLFQLAASWWIYKSFDCTGFFTTLFLIKHLRLLKTSIYQHFMIMMQKYLLSVYLNHIQHYFARFCYRLFWFFRLQSFYNRLFLNLNGLCDGKVAPFAKNENGSLI